MLDELINLYTEGEFDFDVIEDFCDKIEPSYENKQMLIGCIECYDIKALYQTLFGNSALFCLQMKRKNTVKNSRNV